MQIFWPPIFEKKILVSNFWISIIGNSNSQFEFRAIWNSGISDFEFLIPIASPNCFEFLNWVSWIAWIVVFNAVNRTSRTGNSKNLQNVQLETDLFSKQNGSHINENKIVLVHFRIIRFKFTFRFGSFDQEEIQTLDSRIYQSFIDLSQTNQASDSNLEFFCLQISKQLVNTLDSLNMLYDWSKPVDGVYSTAIQFAYSFWSFGSWGLQDLKFDLRMIVISLDKSLKDQDRPFFQSIWFSNKQKHAKQFDNRTSVCLHC